MNEAETTPWSHSNLGAYLLQDHPTAQQHHGQHRASAPEAKAWPCRAQMALRADDFMSPVARMMDVTLPRSRRLIKPSNTMLEYVTACSRRSPMPTVCYRPLLQIDIVQQNNLKEISEIKSRARVSASHVD
jgi:hypothetical protein